jgi:hypothetical protein
MRARWIARGDFALAIGASEFPESLPEMARRRKGRLNPGLRMMRPRRKGNAAARFN